MLTLYILAIYSMFLYIFLNIVANAFFNSQHRWCGLGETADLLERKQLKRKSKDQTGWLTVWSTIVSSLFTQKRHLLSLRHSPVSGVMTGNSWIMLQCRQEVIFTTHESAVSIGDLLILVMFFSQFILENNKVMTVIMRWGSSWSLKNPLWHMAANRGRHVS